MNELAVKRLTRAERDAIAGHFRTLSSADRRLRFGTPLADDAIVRYVDGIDFVRDAVYGVYAGDLVLCGVAHVAASGEIAELGVSVLAGYRRRGHGSALFDRAITWARNQRVRMLYIHCLAENPAILQLARSSRMRVVVESGEADAYLDLKPATAGSAAAELMDDGVAIFDYTLKRYAAAFTRLWRLDPAAPR